MLTGKQQTINLSLPLDPNAPDKADLEIIRAEEVKLVAKRQQKLKEALKKGFVTVYNQCSQEVQDKLESSDNWETMQGKQSLHELIQKIEHICMGFDNHKQEVFNLVQSLKTLFLYTTYCEAHEKSLPSNLMEPWTHETAALGPTGNLQGSLNFYCLNTGRVLKRCSFTPMPMPDRIIKWVNAIGQCEGQGHEFRFLN